MKLIFNFLCVNREFKRLLPSFLLDKPIGIQHTEPLDVDWPVLFVDSVETAQVKFLYSVSINSISCKPFYYLINLVFPPPFNSVCEHEFHLWNYEFSCSAKPQQIVVIPILVRIVVILLYPSSYLIQNTLLRSTQVVYVTIT